ncbi:MAG TPA: carbohydrate ABC transporter substrate-binding protein, partial [Clostridiales bacterium]|nr:carbohydrate ABC transporter substrate-binding protein [Clostridiales bacterium]
MKKVIALILTLTLLIGSLTACKKKVEPETPDDGGKVDVVEPGVETPETPEEPKELTGKLIVWSFTNELQAHTLAFQEAHPGVEVEYTEISMNSGEYQVKVQAAAGTDEVPDCVALEAAFVREWVESDLLLDLSDLLPKAEALDVYQNTIDVGTYDGEVRAYSYQSTPGAVFYRRSLAKEYFGTDDPVEIQNLMSDMDKFEAMAQVVKEKSGGDTYMVSSSGDFMQLFYANRENPWVVDGKLVIDPKVEELMDLAKTFREKGYESQATQWEEGWFAGMNDSLADASGNAKQIFSYFLPTWGLPYVLMTNAGDTAGDWACINGPLPYQWGGTWVGAMKNAKNVETAKAFVEFVTLN